MSTLCNKGTSWYFHVVCYQLQGTNQMNSTNENPKIENIESVFIVDFLNAKKEFMNYLKSNKGRSMSTCYNYSSDLNIWSRWINNNWLEWKECKPVHVEKFVQNLVKDGVGPHGIARRISCLASFYKWAKKNNKVQDDPIYAIDKPKTPRRIPVWLEQDEQHALANTFNRTDNIADA